MLSLLAKAPLDGPDVGPALAGPKPPDVYHELDSGRDAAQPGANPPRIVVLMMHQGDEDIYRALEAGAAAYLLKDTVTTTPWLRPTQVKDGRFWKFSLQYDF
jgi:mono/diheme cytochrome c family protein